MNNIYDVILNFNKYYYEVYEWNNNDDVENIRKIPFFKVSDKAYLNLKNREVIISKKSLSMLKKNCSLLDEVIDEIRCLITNGRECMGIIIDKDGIIIGRSAMLYEEEDEVLEESRGIKKIEIEFDSIGERYGGSRLENEKKKILEEFINNNNDKMILKYIYYDYYLEECDDILEIKNKLLKEINYCEYSSLFKLYNIVMLFSHVK